jgi:hypothetical protein
MAGERTGEGTELEERDIGERIVAKIFSGKTGGTLQAVGEETLENGRRRLPLMKYEAIHNTKPL